MVALASPARPERGGLGKQSPRVWLVPAVQTAVRLMENCRTPSLPPRTLNLSYEPALRASREARVARNILVLASNETWTLSVLRMPSSNALHLVRLTSSSTFAHHVARGHIHFHSSLARSLSSPSPHPRHLGLPYLPKC